MIFTTVFKQIFVKEAITIIYDYRFCYYFSTILTNEFHK